MVELFELAGGGEDLDRRGAGLLARLAGDGGVDAEDDLVAGRVGLVAEVERRQGGDPVQAGRADELFDAVAREDAPVEPGRIRRRDFEVDTETPAVVVGGEDLYSVSGLQK